MYGFAVALLQNGTRLPTLATLCNSDSTIATEDRHCNSNKKRQEFVLGDHFVYCCSIPDAFSIITRLALQSKTANDDASKLSVRTVG